LLKILDSIHVPARKTVVSAMIDEFKILIEEYKISVFAPEMKTICKVSEKRLVKKIQEIHEQL
nr:DUF3418 domain-containing protein [Desulfobulbaceae bacterium]MBF0222870.1 DUF3418 domain-containing protein [Desulfobulbaceae bacterium]